MESNSKQERQRSREKPAKVWTEREYDDFLLTDKQNTFRRIEPFKSLSAHIKHQCLICSRIWKPSPKIVFNDDYYCPSCVLHHRNNMPRFSDPKLSWTANVPNTFYLYSVTDANTKQVFFKYGRTQHSSSLKRYSTTQRDRYAMKLICEVRGKLINTTALENLWKSLANDLGLRMEFSEKEFHGATECINIDEPLKDWVVKLGEKVMQKDLTGFEKFGWKELDMEDQHQLLKQIQRFKQSQKLGLINKNKIEQKIVKAQQSIQDKPSQATSQ